MSMNWYQRRHGWTCSECGTFNEVINFNCSSEECEAAVRNREVREYILRGLIHRYRQQWKRDGGDPTRLLANSRSGMLYLVRRFAGRVGLTYTMLVPGG